MDRRDFLKGALAISGTTVLVPVTRAALGRLAYVRYYATNVGAPSGTSAWFGKHTQWAYCPKDGKLRAYGGDGDWRLQDVNFQQQQSLNSVLAYDFANDAKFEQETRQWGNPADGTMPWFHDGCTWTYNSQEDKFYAIPGYQARYGPPFPMHMADPNKIAKLAVVHKYNRTTRVWEEGPAVGSNWFQEHWGGCYDSKRNRIWIQCSVGNESGGLKWFDCVGNAWGRAGLNQTPRLGRYPNIGFEVITSPWPQRYNWKTDEIICFDGYRGHVIGVPLSTMTPRIIANVPALRGDVPGEPVGTIETGVCISVARQKAFLSYSTQSVFAVGGVGGVWSVDLETGKTEHVDYPTPPGVDASWTEAEYDDTNDCLILTGNINDSAVWGRRFLRFQFARPALVAAAGPLPRASARVAWLKDVPLLQWLDIPNSQLTAHLGDEYFERIGLPRPTQHRNTVSWGTNKYGIRWPVWEGIGWFRSGGHTSHSGLGFDSRGSKILVGGGDAHWAENGYHQLQIGIDNPQWTQEVIRSCHKDDFKNPVWPLTTPLSYPALLPGDDGRVDRMYDGSHRGGHSYFFQWFIEAREWMCHFGQQQFWPTDAGTSPLVHVGELALRAWRKDNPIPAVPNWLNDELPWIQKHPITEDIYAWGTAPWSSAGVLSVWRQATNMWETVVRAPEEAGARVTGSIDWINGYILMAGRIGSRPHTYWMTDLASPKKVQVSILGQHAAAFQPGRHGGLWWCPDIRKHLYYPDNGVVYTVERTAAAEFTVEHLPMTGTAPANGVSFNTKAGGILNNFQYARELGGMVLRLSDMLPMKFFRTR